MKNDTSLQVLDFADVTGQALDAAQKMASEVIAQEEKVATLVPPRVDALFTQGLIPEDEKQAANDKLSTHEGALEVVGNLLKIAEEQKQNYEQKLAAAGNGRSVANGELAGNGSPRVTKQADAGANYSDGGYVGRRRGAGERAESDQVIIDQLGLGGRFSR